MHRKLVLTYVSVLFLFFMLIGVNGHNPGYEIVAVYGSTPTIDGSINVDEWSDAASVHFNNTEVFVKQDGENLYIGWKVSPVPFQVSDNTVGIGFDVNNTGESTSSLNPIAIGVFVNNGTLAETKWFAPEGRMIRTAVSGWTASVNSTLDMWQVEFNIPYSKVEVVAGEEKTIGVLFEVSYGEKGMHDVYRWPPCMNAWFYHLEDWGDITSTGYNWIPEFPSFLILPLFMIITLLAVIVYRRKQL